MKPLLDVIFNLNRKVSYNAPIYEKIKFNSIIRYLLRLVANTVLPHVFKLCRYKKNGQELPIVVSLTSFPARIGKVWMVIESILRQSAKAERIVLWLSKEQFPNEYNDLPQVLIDQQNRGLEVVFIDGDIRSHKKYYYAFRNFPDKYILTIDDDLLFPSGFLMENYLMAKNFPNSVIANFGSKIKWNKELDCFEDRYERIDCQSTGKNLFFGSGGGTLFPPNKLNRYIEDASIIMDLCPTADDIYLNAISRLAGLDITFKEVLPLLSIENKNDFKLTSVNGNIYSSDSINTEQLRRLVKFFITKYGVNPFLSP